MVKFDLHGSGHGAFLKGLAPEVHGGSLLLLFCCWQPGSNWRRDEEGPSEGKSTQLISFYWLNVLGDSEQVEKEGVTQFRQKEKEDSVSLGPHHSRGAGPSARRQRPGPILSGG